MLQCPPNFFYVEVSKVDDFDFLGEKGERFGWDLQKIIVALDFENEELDLKTLGFGNFDLETFGLENLGCFEKDFEVGCLDLRKYVLQHSSSES